jgi:hypothetical protein
MQRPKQLTVGGMHTIDWQVPDAHTAVLGQLLVHEPQWLASV